jgi:L,D-transpeptidase-like protein/putative peptidoglycan binding protein
VVSKVVPVRVAVCLALACAVVGGAVVAGAVLRDDKQETAAPAKPRTTTTTLPPTTTTLVPTTTTLPTTVQQPAPDPTLPVLGLGDIIGPGATGPVVAAFEQRLANLHFDPGPVDGVYDQDTLYAVQTLQKMTGLNPAGRIGAYEADALRNFQYPQPLHPTAEPNRTEIDVTKQVLTLYNNYQVRLVTTTSTGSGVHYCYDTPKDDPTAHVCEVATTPSGRFTYYMYRNGWDKGVLGALYNPFYFNKGIAVHGYQSVPPTPASHGCARIPMRIAEYFHTLVNQGDPVYVDGGQPAQILSSTPINRAPAFPVAPIPGPGTPTPTAPPATAPPATAPPAPPST